MIFPDWHQWCCELSSLPLPVHITHTHNHFTALWILSGTVDNPGEPVPEHSPTHTYRATLNSYRKHLKIYFAVPSPHHVSVQFNRPNTMSL